MAIPEIGNEHHQSTAAGVEQYLRQHNYNMFLSVTNFNADEEQRCLQLLKQQRFDGLIISLGTGSTLQEEIVQLTNQGYVITGLGFDEEHIDYVRTEAVTGERQLLEHLVNLGHRRIGYIYGVANHDLFNNRLATCLSIQRDLGVPVVEQWICRCGPSRDDGYHATQELLHMHSANELPTALVVVNDMLASAVEVALHEAHIRIPEEMSVASFDNTSLATYTFPPLTSVDCEGTLMGEQAARMTIERLSAPQRPVEHLYTHAQLIVRSSTGPAPRIE
jgi:LacI family transcriptional regulator